MIYQIIVTIAGFIAFLNIAAAAYLFFLKYRKKKKLERETLAAMKGTPGIDLDDWSIKDLTDDDIKAIEKVMSENSSVTVIFNPALKEEYEEKDLPDNVVDFNSLKKKGKDE